MPRSPILPGGPHPEDLPKNDSEALCEALLKWLKVTEKVSKLSDTELSIAVVDKIWGRITKLGTEEEALLNELINRFEKHAGIERDEEGEVIEKGNGWKS